MCFSRPAGCSPRAQLWPGIQWSAVWYRCFQLTGGPGAFRLTRDGSYTEWQPFANANPPIRLLAVGDGFFGARTLEMFRMTATGDVTPVYVPTGLDGVVPLGDLMRAQDGHVYGTAASGGTADLGTVFRITLDGSFEKLHDFSGNDGERSYSGLCETTPAVFYGMTTSGGPGGGGVIFRLSTK